MTADLRQRLAFDYPAEPIGRCLAVHADCFEWLARLPENSLHAVVTDPQPRHTSITL